LNYFPSLRLFPKYRDGMKQFLTVEKILIEMVKKRIEISLSDEADENFIRSYVIEEGQDLDYDQLQRSIVDLFVAGTETTATTLQWMMILLANHSDIQRRIHEEIDKVVPRSRLPSLDDKANLPLVEASILELMRIKTLVPLAVPHKTIGETYVDGYYVPPNTTILVNLFSAHMDPEIWHDPENFHPDRFLDSSGSVINKELVIPFSIGKRSCLGELLARQEIYLFMTGLLQHFDILPPVGQTTVDSKGTIGITNSPAEYNVRLVKRSSQ
jgi:cytochrome P450